MKDLDKLPWIEGIIDYSEDAIISKDLNNIIVSWNKGAEKLYGYKAEEVVGKPISIIIPKDKISDILSTAEIIEQRKDIMHLETVRIAKDGTRYDVSVSVSPIFNSKGELIGSSAIARNITERKKHEEILRKSEERYRKIVELSPDAIIIHQDSYIKFINQAGIMLLGATDARQIIGKNIWNFYTPDIHGIVRTNIQTLKFTGQPITNVEHTIIRLDGKTITAETSSCTINYENQTAIYVIMRDVTERKKIGKFLELQYATSNNLIESSNLIDGLTATIKIICNTLKFNAGRIWTLSAKEKSLNCIATWANTESAAKFIDKSKNKMSLKVDERFIKNMDTKKEGIWEYINDKHLYHENDDFKLRVEIPIVYNKKLVGILELLHNKTLPKDDDLLRSLQSINSQIAIFIKNLQSEENLLFNEKHDLLTKLPNRTFFEETMMFQLYSVKSKRQRMAVLLLDIDNFSSINESAGYPFGDNILKIIANILNTQLKLHDNAARFGGDQFVALLSGFNTLDDITNFAKNINLIIKKTILEKNINFNIQVNIGISLYPEDGDTVKTLLQKASIALTNVKKQGGERFQFCTSEMSSREQNRIIIENKLQEALDKNEFILHYQPSIDSKNMQIIGFEALLRWQHNGKTIPPIEFIEILEESRIIIPVGAWILRSACEQCIKWQKQAPGTSISVNISPIQLHNSNIVEDITSAIQLSKIKTNLLKIEITESAIMNDVQACTRILYKIKELGVKIALDDFGTGYSSLSYLPNLPIDYLKIDRSFIMHMVDNRKDAAIVKTIIELASNLGISVIAEGVETQTQLELINTLGCFEIQGFYFSRPLNIKEAEDLLNYPKKYLG